MHFILEPRSSEARVSPEQAAPDLADASAVRVDNRTASSAPVSIGNGSDAIANHDPIVEGDREIISVLSANGEVS